MKVNLGCGGDIREGYLNYDCRDLPGVDMVDDIWNLASHVQGAEEILALDIIEHVSWTRQKELLKLFHDCLVPGGKLIIKTPDLRVIAAALLHGLYPPREVISLLYGRQDYQENSHISGYTMEILFQDLTEIGFCSFVGGRSGGFNMLVEAKRNVDGN